MSNRKILWLSLFLFLSIVSFVFADTIYLKNGKKGEYTGLWGAVGGKIEKDESPAAAIAREIREETGLKFKEKELSLFKTVYIRYPQFDYTYNIFYTRIAEKPPVKIEEREIAEYKWVNLEEALKLPLIPDEDGCVKMFCEEILSSKKTIKSALARPKAFSGQKASFFQQDK